MVPLIVSVCASQHCRHYIPATGTTPHTATLVNQIRAVPSDFTGTVYSGNRRYSTGTLEGPLLYLQCYNMCHIIRASNVVQTLAVRVFFLLLEHGALGVCICNKSVAPNHGPFLSVSRFVLFFPCRCYPPSTRGQHVAANFGGKSQGTRGYLRLGYLVPGCGYPGTRYVILEPPGMATSHPLNRVPACGRFELGVTSIEF